MISKRSSVLVVSVLVICLLSSIASAQATFARKISNVGQSAAITTTRNGGNLLVSHQAFAGPSIFVRKLNASGGKVWQRALHPDALQRESLLGGGVTQLLDGGYVLTGTKIVGILDFPSSKDALVVKLTAGGNIEWKKSFPENSFGSDLSSVVAFADGGFAAAGVRAPLPGFPFPFIRSSSTTNRHIIVASFDSGGEIRWAKLFDSPSLSSLTFPFLLSAVELMQTSNHALIVACQGLVFKLDSGGKLLWKKFLRRKGLQFNNAVVTTDGGCILLFSSGKDIFSVRLSAQGKIIWKKGFRIASQNSNGLTLTSSSDGGFAIAGRSGNSKGFILRLGSKGNAISTTLFNVKGNGIPHFILPASNSGFVLFGSSFRGNDLFVFKVDSNTNLPTCNATSSVTTESRPFGSLQISSPAITTSDWAARGVPVGIRSAPMQVRDSKLCP